MTDSKRGDNKHEEIEAILKADPRCVEGDYDDEEVTTVRFLGPEQAARMREQLRRQEERNRES